MDNCIICEQPLRLTWTDTHGVSACMTCCNPYRSYKYTGDKRENVCENLTKAQFIPLMKRYWSETKKKIPHSFDMGMSEGLNRDRSYSGLSVEDFEAFSKWLKNKKNKAEHDAIQNAS